MIGKLDEVMDFQARALKLRSYRQQLLASNIANGDTPNYKAVDIDFAAALNSASQNTSAPHHAPRSLAATSARHIAGAGGADGGAAVQFRGATQASIDGNSVDLDVERAHFADNAVRYEAALRFLNGQIRTLASAIKGE
jgi:flagellar basal-body rod protein FlgB